MSLVEHSWPPTAGYCLGDVRYHANRNEEAGHIVEHERGRRSVRILERFPHRLSDADVQVLLLLIRITEPIVEQSLGILAFPVAIVFVTTVACARRKRNG